MNVGGKKEEISADTRAILQETAGLDQALYAYAATLFEHQIQAYDGDLTKECEKYQRNNAMIQPIYLPYLHARRRFDQWRYPVTA